MTHVQGGHSVSSVSGDMVISCRAKDHANANEKRSYKWVSSFK